MDTRENLPSPPPEETPEEKPPRTCADFPMIPFILENGQEVLV